MQVNVCLKVKASNHNLVALVSVFIDRVNGHVYDVKRKGSDQEMVTTTDQSEA